MIMQFEKIGKYEIVRLLGEGSTGTVYKAFDPIIDRFVALKVIPGEKISQPEYLQRFKKEVRAQGRVMHPNVAVIFDVDFQDGDYVIVMEYVEGRSLRQVMKEEHKIALGRFCRIIFQICDGLDCAHRNGVIHRDIKPEHIFINSEGQVKILDFSIAKLESSATITGVNFLLGTAFYMAPEQILGLAVTPASDQFSLGIVAYEMLTGIKPFAAATLADSILNITRKEPAPISEANPLVDPLLESIVLKTMAKEPPNRYPSVMHFKKALKTHFIGVDTGLEGFGADAL